MSLGVVLLCSGSGGNLRFVDACIEHGLAPGLRILAVLTDRDCAAGTYAKARGIPTRCLDFELRSQQGLLEALEALRPDIVVTTVHRILGPEVVAAFRGRLVNLHYSLLPAFPGRIGTTPVKQALEYGARFIGTTVHLVDEAVDAGRPIIQSVTPTLPGDRVEDVMDCVFRCGCIALMHALESLGSGARKPEGDERPFIDVGGRRSFFNPAPIFRREYGNEAFWNEIGSRGR